MRITDVDVPQSQRLKKRNGPDSLLPCIPLPPFILPTSPFPLPPSSQTFSLQKKLSLKFSLSVSLSLSISSASKSSRVIIIIVRKPREREKKKKMLLGKRPRPPMKRTTSITEFTLDLSMAEAPPPPQGGGVDGGAAAASPRNQRRNFAELETSNFLRACSLCKRRLVPGRDIYMYKGDSAFCSLECRQQQMNHDERKDKCSLASSKKQAVPATAAAGSKVGSTK